MGYSGKPEGPVIFPILEKTTFLLSSLPHYSPRGPIRRKVEFAVLLHILFSRRDLARFVSFLSDLLGPLLSLFSSLFAN